MTPITGTFRATTGARSCFKRSFVLSVTFLHEDSSVKTSGSDRWFHCPYLAECHQSRGRSLYFFVRALSSLHHGDFGPCTQQCSVASKRNKISLREIFVRAVQLLRQGLVNLIDGLVLAQSPMSDEQDNIQSKVNQLKPMHLPLHFDRMFRLHSLAVDIDTTMNESNGLLQRNIMRSEIVTHRWSLL